MTFTTAEIAKRLDGEVLGAAHAALTGFASAADAKPGDLTFAENTEFFAAAENSAATAIIAGREFSSDKKIVIRVANARIGFAKALAIFFPEPKFAPGIHPSAVVAKSANVDASAHLGPHCVVGERVNIGANCVLQSGNSIGNDSALGDETNLFPNVTIYPRSQIGKRVRIHAGSTIGSDGFGYVLDAGVHRKVPQVGHVVIGDDVEIGANVAIDRGALGATTIGRGTKIDNLVQIAHNVVIGENCIVIAQVGIAGSTRLGNYVILAGQVGLAGHITIGDQATIGAQSGVMWDVPAGTKWMGSIAQPERDFKRQYLALQRLPDLLKKISAWEKKLGGGQA